MTYRDFVVCYTYLLGGIYLHIATLQLPLNSGIFFIGLILETLGLVGLFSLEHEAWHGRAIPNQSNHAWCVKYLVSGVLAHNFEREKKRHMTHHSYNGGKNDEDRWMWLLDNKSFWIYLIGRLLIFPILLARLKNIRMDSKIAKNGNHRPTHITARIKQSLPIILVHGVWAGTLAIISPKSLFLAYFLPLLLSSTFSNLRYRYEHRFTKDGELKVYDTDCNWVERSLIAGGYFNFHGLHHLFPNLPQRDLPKLMMSIKTSPEVFKTYLSFKGVYGYRKSYFMGQI